MMSSKINLPNLLICLGPSLAGKTTLIKAWQEAFPDYEHVDDRPVVMEYLALDALVHEAGSTELLTHELKLFGRKSKYLCDLAEKYICEIDETHQISKPHYCTQTIDYGQGEKRPALDYQIGHPSVWDDILTRLGHSLRPEGKYILEFARGHRDIYLKEHNIKPSDVYPRALSCLMSSMPVSLKQSVAIIHITCDFEKRFIRNDIRRKTTGQELPDSVLCDVFRHDVFETKQTEKTAAQIQFYTTQVDKLSLPTLTILNNHEIAPELRQGHFSQIIRTTIEYISK